MNTAAVRPQVAASPPPTSSKPASLRSASSRAASDRPGTPRAFAAILFAEDFDEPPRPAEPEPEAEPEVIEPLFSAEELEAARAAAHAQGVSEGLTQSEEAHRQAVRVAVQSIAEALADARVQARQVVDAAAEALARSLLGTVCAALPSLCARHGETELQAVMQALLPSLNHEPQVTVRVHPSLVAPLAAQIQALGAELADIVALTPSELLLPGDARVTWQHGSAIRDTRSILAEIDDALGLIGLREAPPRAALHLADRAGRMEELAHVG